MPNAALDAVPLDLRRFFEPQLEQTHAELLPASVGVRAHFAGEGIDGELWAFALSPTCLVTMHTITVARPTPLVEEPGTYACLCCGVKECFDGAPVARPAHVRTADNLFTFAQGGGSTSFELQPSVAYTSRSLCLTEGFPGHNPELWPLGFECMAAGFNLLGPNMSSPKIRSLLRLVSCAAARNAGAARTASIAARRALDTAMADVAAMLRAHERAGANSQRQLVSHAKMLVRSNLDEPFSLDALARNLLVSRSTLCAAFKAETGMSLGAFAQGERILTACDLLANSRLSVAAVAERVGYARQGSFTDAFKAATGQTPTAWRKAH